jgi:hypothetical protein
VNWVTQQIASIYNGKETVSPKKTYFQG